LAATKEISGLTKVFPEGRLYHITLGGKPYTEVVINTQIVKGGGGFLTCRITCTNGDCLKLLNDVSKQLDHGGTPRVITTIERNGVDFGAFTEFVASGGKHVEIVNKDMYGPITFAKSLAAAGLHFL
jgi:hypothetical protein